MSISHIVAYPELEDSHYQISVSSVQFSDDVNHIPIDRYYSKSVSTEWNVAGLLSPDYTFVIDILGNLVNVSLLRMNTPYVAGASPSVTSMVSSTPVIPAEMRPAQVYSFPLIIEINGVMEESVIEFHSDGLINIFRNIDRTTAFSPGELFTTDADKHFQYPV